ncbi:MAG: hypothetical protein K0U74_08805 [Alphaproteobacteria bacterium]|nr:hypothetical protein [Alphaproteobacteria bacterium]
MGDWSSYSLADFLLFSPRVYDRMFVLLNQDIWPAQIALLAVGLIVVVLAYRGNAFGKRVALLVLGLFWASLALVFFPGRYQAINWLGDWLALAAGLQAALMIGLGCLPSSVFAPRRLDRFSHAVALSLLIFGLLVYPLIAVVAGRGLEGAEVAGAAPDPTAIATLGLAILLTGTARWVAMAVPIAWCVFTGLTLWTLGYPEFWVVPLVVVGLLVAVLRGE